MSDNVVNLVKALLGDKPADVQETFATAIAEVILEDLAALAPYASAELFESETGLVKRKIELNLLERAPMKPSGYSEPESWDHAAEKKARRERLATNKVLKKSKKEKFAEEFELVERDLKNAMVALDKEIESKKAAGKLKPYDKLSIRKQMLADKLRKARKLKEEVETMSEEQLDELTGKGQIERLRKEAGQRMRAASDYKRNPDSMYKKDWADDDHFWAQHDAGRADRLKKWRDAKTDKGKSAAKDKLRRWKNMEEDTDLNELTGKGQLEKIITKSMVNSRMSQLKADNNVSDDYSDDADDHRGVAKLWQRRAERARVLKNKRDSN